MGEILVVLIISMVFGAICGFLNLCRCNITSGKYEDYYNILWGIIFGIGLIWGLYGLYRLIVFAYQV